MAGKITKRDAAAVERLVARYGAAEVTKAVRVAAPRGSPGRLPSADLNAVVVWAFAEHRRVRGDNLPPHSAFCACEFLARDLMKWVVNGPRSKSRLYQLHGEGAKMREADAQAREFADSVLQSLLRDFPAAVDLSQPNMGNKPFPLLVTRAPGGGLASTIFDRAGRGGDH